jgi:predicted ribosomally synthesized peptide with nif11-like leader
MSEEQLKAFLAKITSNPELRARLEQSGADPQALAQELGLTIDADDWAAYLASQIEGLSDGDLEGVAGGTRSTFYETQCAPQCKDTNVLGCTTEVVGCQTRKGWTCP